MMANDFIIISEAPNNRSKRISDSACLPQKTTPFLWVTTQDLKNQSHTSLRRKQSFIKTRTHRLRKETQLQKLKASLKPFPRPKTSCTSDQSYQDGERGGNENNRHAPPGVVLRSMQAGLFEAFHALPQNTNESMDFYLHHYKTYVSQIAFPLSSNVMSVWFLRTALSQPALVETVLLMGAGCLAGRLTMTDGSTRQLQRTMQDTLQLRSRSLNSLQSLLVHSSGEVSEEILLVIALLMCVESAQVDLVSVEAHINGLQYVITRLGGLEKISLQTLSVLYCCDALQGIVRNSPPAFGISKRWETWIRRNSSCLEESPFPASPSLGQRFHNAFWFGDLPDDLINIIKAFGKLVCLHERMIEIDFRHMPAENECFLLMMHQLYSLPYKVPTTPFDDVICISILVYATSRVWGLQSKPCLEHLSRNLQQRILRCYDQLQMIALDLLFWSLFLGGLISKELGVHGWFLTHLKATAECIDVHDWVQALAVLEGFIFVGRSSDEPARELWKLVCGFEDRRKSTSLLSNEHVCLKG